MATIRTAVAVLTIACVASGCGSGSPARKHASESALTTASTRCVPTPTAPSTPTPLPADVPLPPGTVVKEASAPSERAGNYRQFTLVSPVTLNDLGRFIDAAWPAAGLVLGAGDREGNELDATFTSDKLIGALRGTSGFCDPGVTQILLKINDRPRPTSGGQ